MNKKRTVRYELMLGREATEAIRSFPVGYLPIGCLERHGDHLPMGLDVLKGHKVCCKAAEAIGGIVFPPHFYAGIHRLSEERMQQLTSEWGNIYTDASAQENLCEVVNQIAQTGIRVLVLYSGHYPPCQTEMIEDISNNFKNHKFFAIIPFYEAMILDGDHAGVSETSFLLYLDKDLVDMSRISEVNYQDHGWTDVNTPEKATIEKGEADTKLVIEHLKKEIESTLTGL